MRQLEVTHDSRRLHHDYSLLALRSPSVSFVLFAFRPGRRRNDRDSKL